MSGETAQLASRELAGLKWSPEWPTRSYLIRYGAIVSVIALGLGVSGAVWPGPLLPTLPRSALWLITCLLTALQYILAGAMLGPVGKALRLPRLVLWAALPLVIVPFCAIEYALISRAFGLLREMPLAIAALMFAEIFLRNTYLIALPSALVIRWCLQRSLPSANSLVQTVPRANAPAAISTHEIQSGEGEIVKQLPAALRAPIIALKAEDHYVRVFTERGDTLLLMRFADAVDRLAAADGMRVHRSYWVRISAIDKTTRDGRRLQLHLDCGLTVPVSRAQEDSVTARLG